jgi:ubiquinone/menaquinone biosynthesis C-methylase UbiE
MQPLDPAVVRHYETIREEDRIASGIGELELLRVQEVLQNHLPGSPANVIDIGGGTGVHASWLADMGYRVQVLDIAPRHVAKVNAELSTKGVSARLGDARRVPYPDETFDVALLFGPLYHLTEQSDRILALQEAIRVIRPGGTVAVAAVNRFASLFDGLGRQFLFDPDFRLIAGNDLADGQHRNPDERPNWWTTAYLHHPDQLRSESEQAGLLVRQIVGLEGLAAYLPQLAERWESAVDRETIIWSARAIETEPTLLGLSAHLLLIGEKPSS